MTYRPLIAVVAYHLDGQRVARWREGGYAVPAPYVEALQRAGGRVAIVPAEPDADPAEALRPFDGLVLAGGGDVDPARYGADPDATHLYGVDPERDAFEIALLLEAARAHLPTLCICRGMQVMNVAFGGTLHQHLPDLPGLLAHGVPVEDTQAMHDVAPVPGMRLSASTKAGTLTCSSHHHQGVDRIGDGLEVTGRSPDGLVEALEHGIRDFNDPDAGWMVGVQWHPEETAATDPTQQRLFQALVEEAAFRGQAVHGGGSHDYHVADPNPAWPQTYAAEERRLRDAVPPDVVVRTDHIGSTSVPGLPAKPVIDIQLAVDSMVPVDRYREPLQALGYLHKVDGWNDDHEFFHLRAGERQDGVNLHVCQADSPWEIRHLAFRDWLRTHPEDAEAYATLKRDLAATHPRDIASYVSGKSAFIAEVTQRALDAGLGTRD
jgi:putative glutamine amidotransferase